jgi:HSP20 family protein
MIGALVQPIMKQRRVKTTSPFMLISSRSITYFHVEVNKENDDREHQNANSNPNDRIIVRTFFAAAPITITYSYKGTYRLLVTISLPVAKTRNMTLTVNPYFSVFPVDRPLLGFDDCFSPTQQPTRRSVDASGEKENDKRAIMPVIPNLIRKNDMILQASSPGYEMFETDGKLMICMDVPGIKLADVSVQVEDDGKVLHIAGKRQGPTANNGATMHTMKFSKRFTIGNRVDVDRMTANLSDGVLSITAPVKEKTSIPDHAILITENLDDV